MSFKQVFIINNDLRMRKGKIAVQVAHGETLYMSEVGACKCVSMIHELEDKEHKMKNNFKEWSKDGLMKKIVLKASEKEMLRIIDKLKAINNSIWYNIVYDKGLTQVPTNSMTCIVLEPLDDKEANERFGYLSLL